MKKFSKDVSFLRSPSIGFLVETNNMYVLVTDISYKFYSIYEYDYYWFTIYVYKVTRTFKTNLCLFTAKKDTNNITCYHTH